MSDSALERYREALRQGHQAALRGDPSAAATAYREAAALAPERPLPHVGLGTALHELGRPSEALAAFDRALELAPLDEPALRGRAAALTALGRNADAAVTLTGLAESLEADGRVADALELARQALALSASPGRFRLVARLSAVVRAQAATATADGGAGDGTMAATLDGVTGATSRPGGASVGITLIAEADALLDAGRQEEARQRYLMAARTHREGGRLLAALDACYQALAIAPADPELHLILAEIYEERGWSGAAVDKLVLLVRLLDLLGDQPGRDRLCGLVKARFATEPRLAALCG